MKESNIIDLTYSLMSIILCIHILNIYIVNRPLRLCAWQTWEDKNPVWHSQTPRSISVENIDGNRCEWPRDHMQKTHKRWFLVGMFWLKQIANFFKHTVVGKEVKGLFGKITAKKIKTKCKTI